MGHSDETRTRRSQPRYGRTRIRGSGVLEDSEPVGPDAVLLHLAVQRPVVGSQVPGRLALIPPGSFQGTANRVLLGIGEGRLANRLQ